MPANHMASLNLREYFSLGSWPLAPVVLAPRPASSPGPSSKRCSVPKPPWNTPSYLHHDETTL